MPPTHSSLLSSSPPRLHLPTRSCKHNYELVSKCVGHSGNIEHIDWSLPIAMPGFKLHGQMIIRSADASGNLLYWDPRQGRKIAHNQRDAPMHTSTSRIGFDVMGIWAVSLGLQPPSLHPSHSHMYTHMASFTSPIIILPETKPPSPLSLSLTSLLSTPSPSLSLTGQL